MLEMHMGNGFGALDMFKMHISEGEWPPGETAAAAARVARRAAYPQADCKSSGRRVLGPGG